MLLMGNQGQHSRVRAPDRHGAESPAGVGLRWTGEPAVRSGTAHRPGATRPPGIQLSQARRPRPFAHLPEPLATVPAPARGSGFCGANSSALRGRRHARGRGRDLRAEQRVPRSPRDVYAGSAAAVLPTQGSPPRPPPPPAEGLPERRDCRSGGRGGGAEMGSSRGGRRRRCPRCSPFGARGFNFCGRKAPRGAGSTGTAGAATSADSAGRHPGRPRARQGRAGHGPSPPPPSSPPVNPHPPWAGGLPRPPGRVPCRRSRRPASPASWPAALRAAAPSSPRCAPSRAPRGSRRRCGPAPRRPSPRLGSPAAARHRPPPRPRRRQAPPCPRRGGSPPSVRPAGAERSGAVLPALDPPLRRSAAGGCSRGGGRRDPRSAGGSCPAGGVGGPAPASRRCAPQGRARLPARGLRGAATEPQLREAARKVALERGGIAGGAELRRARGAAAAAVAPSERRYFVWLNHCLPTLCTLRPPLKGAVGSDFFPRRFLSGCTSTGQFEILDNLKTLCSVPHVMVLGLGCLLCPEASVESRSVYILKRLPFS